MSLQKLHARLWRHGTFGAGGWRVERPGPQRVLQHLCLDKAYDNKTGDGVCENAGYVAHIRRIGEEKFDGRGEKTHPARRWVVERTIAWLQRCRGILVRYDKKPENYEGRLIGFSDSYLALLC